MNFVDRIDELLREKNLKRSALCEVIGITRTALSDWKTRGTIPAGDVCLRIAKYLNVSVEWLISGICPEPYKVIKESEIENLYNKLDSEEQRIFVEIGNVLVNNGTKK